MSHLTRSWSQLRRHKTASALIVLVLGSTLGATLCAALFTNLLMRSPLPYPQQQRLVVAEQRIADSSSSQDARQFSYPAIASLHAAKDVFAESVMLDRARDIVTSLSDQPLAAVTYTTDAYRTLFAPPMAKGRFFSGTDSSAGATAVLSDSAWQTLFGRRDDVIGQVLQTASGTAFEIVGVTAPSFVEPQLYGPSHRTDIWLPWRFNPSPAQWGWRAMTDTLVLVGRLQPNVQRDQASARLSAILQTQPRQGAPSDVAGALPPSGQIELHPAQTRIAASGALVGPLLLASTPGLVLIALVNVSHVLTARLLERRRDLMIRRALGANTARLFSLLFFENLILMLATAVVALACAALAIKIMQRFLGDMLPRLNELSLTAPFFGYTLLVVLILAGLLAVIVLGATGRLLLASEFHLGRPGVSAKINPRARVMLMAGQIAIAALLLVASLALLRETRRVIAESEALVLAGTYSAFLFPRPGRDTDATVEPQLDLIQRRLEALAGVEYVSQSHSPLQDDVPAVITAKADRADHAVGLKRIDSQYLAMVGERLLRGKNFAATDDAESSDVAIVNETFARKLSAQGDVLGAQLLRGNTAYSIIGVVADVAYPGRAQAPRIYLPASKAGTNLVIRYQPGTAMTRQAFVEFLESVSPELGVFLYDDLAQQRAQLMRPMWLSAVATVIVSLLVALLSGIGLYGMVRYATGLRSAEIGVRRAFGAKDRDVVWLLVRAHFAALAWGLVSSVAIGFVLLNGPWISSLGAAPATSIWTETVVTFAALALLSVLACYLSARPLLAQSPNFALSQEG